MTDFLIKHFVKNHNCKDENKTREAYGILGGVTGIALNLILFVIKSVTGIVTGSMAIITDAFNNLSDMGTSLVSVIGSKIGGKSADKNHPYGHGRAEYVSALIISFLIIFFGAELLKSSFLNIFKDSAPRINFISAIILIISVAVKLWMYFFNKDLSKRCQSNLLYAAAKDSLNDAAATGAVIISSAASAFTTLPLDAFIGLCLSVLIIKTGIDISKDTINRLMGTAPTAELIDKIENLILKSDKILGMHDLMVHDYGPGRKIASVHAEVYSDLSICEIHQIIDNIEKQIMSETGVDIVIHMDPVACKFKNTKEQDN